jgi:hypothetical protein
MQPRDQAWLAVAETEAEPSSVWRSDVLHIRVTDRVTRSATNRQHSKICLASDYTHYLLMDLLFLLSIQMMMITAAMTAIGTITTAAIQPTATSQPLINNIILQRHTD